MQHSIDRIIIACNTAIESADKAEQKRHDTMVSTYAANRKLMIEKRKTAAQKFTEIAARLAAGDALTEQQSKFLDNLHRWRNSNKDIRIHDLTDDLNKEPEANAWPAPAYIYDLLKVMTNLKLDNEDKTTVSTSFLKDAGFGTDVIRWLARV